MYKESKAGCDICGNRILDGENMRCENCYRGLLVVNEKLKERINELEKRIGDLTRALGGT